MLFVCAVNKATSLGYMVVKADEYLTSTMCPICTASGQISRLAKPTDRTCVCLRDGCQRWIDRDNVGGHNLAVIGRSWIRDLTRPSPLKRPTHQQ